MNAWYNEIDPFAAQWIENLATAGHVAAGPVEQRSVVDLRSGDVPGARQFHFFAGIGGWSRALRLAGWPDDVPVWTGSCPCQPFSGAGRKQGFDDERHLWPAWFDIIRERQPSIIFGEQVASPAGLGWLDAVSADLENAGYAFGAADLCAAGVGAPHIRSRLYFVALSEEQRRRQIGAFSSRRGSGSQAQGMEQRSVYSGDGVVAESDSRRCGPQGKSRMGREMGTRPNPGVSSKATDSGLFGFWSPAEWLDCRDGKSRPVEPGTRPLAHGISGRVGRLRGYGNAIVPQVAAVFIKAVMMQYGIANDETEAAYWNVLEERISEDDE